MARGECAPGRPAQGDSWHGTHVAGVLSTIKGGYAFYNGTSMATPHVAGVAALLLSDDPSRTPQQITRLITDTAVPRSSVECPRPRGAGLLSAAGPIPAAVQLGVSPNTLEFNVGAAGTVTATLTRGGQPLAGCPVAFASGSTRVARIQSSDWTTNGSGIARATVEAPGAGTTAIAVTAENQRQTLSVRAVQAPAAPVPALSTWSILLLVATMLLALRRRVRG